MSDLDSLMRRSQSWLEPLAGDDGPGGPNLEYDNAFLELNTAAEGKPETQFDKGEPPDWRAVRAQAEDLLDRSRDLRLAMLWVRALVNVEGVPALGPGLALITGLLRQRWDDLHPKPDEGDPEPYARASVLALLPQMEGVLGDLLHAPLVTIKGVGTLRLRDLEVALNNLGVREGETAYPRDQLERMLASAEEEGSGLRALLSGLQAQALDLGKAMDERFGAGSSAEQKPLRDLFAHALPLLPEPVSQAEAAGGTDAAAASGSGAAAPRAGLSGAVNSRAEAVRAIELVCAYLERHEPTNPAQLFLRRARALLERNFLELVKELAPNALDEVARMVGVDPNTIGENPS